MGHRSHTTRARLVAPVLAAAVAIVASGCGGGGGGGGLDETLSYFPPGASAVVVVSTDLESAQFRNLDAIVEARAHRRIEELLRDAAANVGLSWSKDVKPLLGRELVVGLTAPPVGGPFTGGILAAFHASSGSKLRDVLDRIHALRKGEKIGDARLYRVVDGGATLAADGSVLLFGTSDGQLRAALDRAHGGDHLEEARLDRALDGLPADALVRAYADVPTLGVIPQLARFRGIAWFDALRTVAVTLSFKPHRPVVDFAANTDASRLTSRDLPVATGDRPPGVLDRSGDVVGGNRNQSLTTAFLFRIAEVALPQSRFVEDVHALERELGIDFEQEVLRQFNGPSASAVSLDGKTFAARSEVSDPARLQQLIVRLAPHLPRLVVALQGLQGEGQALLFLFAPDILPLQQSSIRVTPPAQPGGFWHVTGIEGEGPSALSFGVVGSRFVVASSDELARQVATEPARSVPGAHGGAVLRVDLSQTPREQLERANLTALQPLGELVAWVRASVKRVRGQVGLELP
jgi:hypothetical protein